MTSLSQTILDHYQIRKSRKQKDAFLSLMKEHFPELTVEESRFPRNRNLIIGCPETADIVLTAHYDTCARLPFPNFITPKNPLLSILYSVLIVLPLIVILFLFNFLLNLLTADFWIHYTLTLAAYFGFFWLLIAGPANRHNANDNTSGVIVLCELLEALNTDERAKVAFVFFDNEESGLLGSSAFRSKRKKAMDDRLLINFDCVSDGNNFLVSVSKTAREQYLSRLTECFRPSPEMNVLIEKAERVYYPSDQAGFKKSVAVAALKHHRILGYYMNRIHTDRDIIFQRENIDYLCNAVHKFIKCL